MEDQPKSLNILKLWWLLYLTDGYLGRIDTRLALRAETIEQLATSNKVSIASNVAAVLAALVTIWLVREFSKKQHAAFAALVERHEPQTASVIP